MPQLNSNSRPVIDGQNENYGNNNLNQLINTNTKIKKNRDQIKIILFNCNSAKHKMSTIRALVNKHKPNILSLNEVKMNKAEANDELNIPGYDCVRRLTEAHIFNMYNPNKINTVLMSNLEKKYKNILIMGDLN